MAGTVLCLRTVVLRHTGVRGWEVTIYFPALLDFNLSIQLAPHPVQLLFHYCSFRLNMYHILGQTLG